MTGGQAQKKGNRSCLLSEQVVASVRMLRLPCRVKIQCQLRGAGIRAGVPN